MVEWWPVPPADDDDLANDDACVEGTCPDAAVSAVVTVSKAFPAAVDVRMSTAAVVDKLMPSVVDRRGVAVARLRLLAVVSGLTSRVRVADSAARSPET